MLKYKNHVPKFDESVIIFPTATVIGEVNLGKDVNIWFNASVRGDMDKIDILEGTNIQDNAVVHTNTDMPTFIGKYVTVGHSAIIHAATIKDYALIGMGAIINASHGSIEIESGAGWRRMFGATGKKSSTKNFGCW